MPSLAELEAEVVNLNLLVYSPEVKAKVEVILSAIPDPDQQASTDEKVRVLLLRARAKLLLPTFSKEAEVDVNKALRLNQKAPLTWVVLSEAYWRRNALAEARDALESALKIDPKCQPALAQYSRILRSMCSLPDTANEEKLNLLKESENKAREAVSVNPDDGESWSVLGVAIVQQAVARSMDLNLMKKALAALNQAGAKCPQNPDVYYNRGAVHMAFGHFGAAVEDFNKAYTLDPAGLKGARGLTEQNYEILLNARKKSKPFAGLTEKDFKKNVASRLPTKGPSGSQNFVYLADVMDKVFPPIKKDETPKVEWVAVKVMDILCSPSSQPLVYLVADTVGSTSLLLLYRVNSTAVKINDTVMIPFPPSSAASLVHQTPDISFLEVKSDSFATPTILADSQTLLVNGNPIAAKYFSAPVLGTRQFQ